MWWMLPLSLSGMFMINKTPFPKMGVRMIRSLKGIFGYIPLVFRAQLAYL